MVMGSYLYINIYIYTFIFYFILRECKKEWYLRSWLKNLWTRRATDDMVNIMYVSEVLRIYDTMQL